MRLSMLTLSLFASASVAVADVTAIKDVKRNQPVTVAGTVDRFHDEDEISLRDETGTLRIYLGPQPAALELGQRIEVSGFMDDDLVGNELYAREITFEDGTVLTVVREYD